MLVPCAAAAASPPMSARSSSSSDPSASAGTNLFPAATQTSLLWLCTSTEPFGDHVYKSERRSGEAAMRIILSSTLAVLVGSGVALASPSDEVPTSEQENIRARHNTPHRP